MSLRLAFLVTHLWGVGHLSRTLTLARAAAKAGLDTHVISGGTPAAHLPTGDATLHQLPPLRSDGTNFTRLMDGAGQDASPAYRDRRENDLTDLIKALAPGALVTELFPFGRRSLRREFLAAVDTMRALPGRRLVLGSVRDILAPPKKPEKAAYAARIVAEQYDGVLVHSDPAVIPLEHSWPVDAALASHLHYTGFVAPPLPGPEPDGLDEILVSAGGGGLGAALFPAALAAARQDRRTWRLLVSGVDAAPRIAALQAIAPPNAIIEPVRPDFRARLQTCAASISLCGYNTAMDVLQSGVPAVFVPSDEGGEVEQTLRATQLARLPGIEIANLADVSGHTLRAALHRCLEPAKQERGFDFSGATRTVTQISRLYSEFGR